LRRKNFKKRESLKNLVLNSISQLFFLARSRKKTAAPTNCPQHCHIHFSSVSDPNKFQCGSGSSILEQCGSGFGCGSGSRSMVDEENFLFFSIENAIYLSLGLLKRPPSYRQSLQPSKENIKHFKI
jgi:hypothetical protein